MTHRSLHICLPFTVTKLLAAIISYLAHKCPPLELVPHTHCFPMKEFDSRISLRGTFCLLGMNNNTAALVYVTTWFVMGIGGTVSIVLGFFVCFCLFLLFTVPSPVPVNVNF